MKSRRSAPNRPKEDAGPAGNVYDKYHSRNPIERYLVSSFLTGFIGMVDGLEISSILEVGCGEGYVADRLKEKSAGAPIFACDISLPVVRDAKERCPSVRFFCSSVYALPFASGSFDLVVASEVLEHLDKPELALAEISRVSRKYILASVPNEPLWRVLNIARGKYLTRLGNTPGHVMHWSKKGFVELLGRHFEVTGVMTRIPWIACLGRKQHT